MAVMTQCPSCGLESNEIRCPRCNALKVVGCTGSCTVCKTKAGACAAPRLDVRPPSESALEDPDHRGTPLER